MSDPVNGLEQLSESALRDRHIALTAQIATLRAQEVVTLADARLIASLTAEANQIVPLVQEHIDAAALAAEGLPNAVPAPVPAPVVIEVVTPVADAAAAAGALAPGSGQQTIFVEGQEVEAAEAIAAAATLRANVSVRHEAVPEHIVAARREQYSLVASAATSDGAIMAGAPISLTDIGAIASGLMHAQGSSLNGVNVPIVTFNAPESLTASAVSFEHGPSVNSAALTRQVLAEQALFDGVEDEALTAAAFTVCGPPDILRDVPECGNTERYVSGWFRNVQSTHGSIQFYRSFSLADVSAGVVTWDQANQTAIVDGTEATWKPCAQIACLPTVTIGVEAVTQCMCMPTFQTMTSPEAVASALYAIRAATARTADGQLLKFYDLLASKYTYDATAQNPLGATIDIYDLLGRLLGMSAAANRQLDLSGYTLAVESGFIAHLMLDNTMACNPRLAQEAAETLFAGLGIGNIAVTPDWSLTDGAGPWSALLPLNPAASAAIAVPARPTTWKIRLFDGSDFAFLNPQGETFGVVPDFQNKRKNRMCWFGELYQGLGKLGCKPAFTVQVTNLVANGKRAACV